MDEISEVQAQGIEVLVPDRLMATELAGGEAAPEMNLRQQKRTPGLKELRRKMREPAVRICYTRRKAIVEPVFGVLKQQRGMREFRRRGLGKAPYKRIGSPFQGCFQRTRFPKAGRKSNDEKRSAGSNTDS